MSKKMVSIIKVVASLAILGFILALLLPNLYQSFSSAQRPLTEKENYHAGNSTDKIPMLPAAKPSAQAPLDTKNYPATSSPPDESSAQAPLDTMDYPVTSSPEKPSAPDPSPIRDGVSTVSEKLTNLLAPLFEAEKRTTTTGVDNSLRDIRAPSDPLDRENYAHFEDNPVKRVSEQPVSTFSIDVDTGSYSNVRRILKSGRLPPHNAVRVEEFLNYFNYDYPTPYSLNPPFKVTTEIAPTPWNYKTHLLHIGIKGYDIPKEKLPPANLVFLVDVSGSMQSPNKLNLLKSALKLLSLQLTSQDKVALVVYAGAAGLVLEPTAGNNRKKMNLALDRLTAGGSTHGSAGIQLAYAVAEQAFIKDGINRVLLATDGDFNVGTVNFEALKNLIAEKRQSGISLTTLGFGGGNYNDQLMEQLADAGNGNYAYIDTLDEAQKVLIDEISATLNIIAKDVKIQIEFNPVVVGEYRLIGYENRHLKREDFQNDKVDAGEIGAGHTVTALYEIALVGSDGYRLENLRYNLHQNKVTTQNAFHDELAFLRLRYKAPDSDTSQLLEWPLHKREIKMLDQTTEHFRFAAAVAAFGQELRGGKYLEQFSYNEILKLANNAQGQDPYGYRRKFKSLVNLAHSLSH